MYTVVYLPESPKYLYAKERFNELRDCLEIVAYTNGIKNFRKDKLVFDAEYVKEDEGEEKNENLPSNVAEHKISNSQFYFNLAIMSAFFCMFSFSFWLIDFQQEYLGADIYVNFYIAGVVSILAGQVNLILYAPMGLKSLIQLV
jgi:hypothetical protein